LPAKQNAILQSLTYGAIAPRLSMLWLLRRVETSIHDVEAIGRYSGLMGNANDPAIIWPWRFLIWHLPRALSVDRSGAGIFLVLYGSLYHGFDQRRPDGDALSPWFS
jgi:hypothetical protein